MPKRLSDNDLRSCNVDPDRPLDSLADAQLRKIVKKCIELGCYVERKHLGEQRAKRGIDFNQTMQCLKLGQLIRIEPGLNGSKVLRIEWRDQLEGVTIGVIAELEVSRGPSIIITNYVDP